MYDIVSEPATIEASSSVLSLSMTTVSLVLGIVLSATVVAIPLVTVPLLAVKPANTVSARSASHTQATTTPATTPAPMMMMQSMAFSVFAPAAPAAPAEPVDGGGPVPLGTAGNFVMLCKSGMWNIPTSVITGDVAVSPIACTAITGFSLVMDASNTYSTSSQITGKVYAADYGAPTPADTTTAIYDMEVAYTDAAGRTISHEANLNIKGGIIAGTTFTAGVYKWVSDVMFDSDIYIQGSSTDHFIFQSTGNIIAGSGVKIILMSDASGSFPQASNIVWQMAGYIDAGTSSHLEGTFLVKTKAVFKRSSSLNGRILSQTACTLDQATIAQA
jgi:hypothetical protein